MDAAPAPAPASRGASASWRKRHPVGARLLLYGLGLLLAGLLFWLWVGRGELERQDHVAYLWARLESLPVVVQADPNGTEVLKALEAEFADPALPAALRARAERLRGVIARNRKDRAGVDAAFSRARAFDAAQAALCDLEWAQCLVDLGDPAAARQRIPDAPTHPSWTETVWRLLVRAQADAAGGAPNEARAGLGLALDSLPRPLPREPVTWFCLSGWQPSGAALEATRWLLLDGAAGPQAARTAWRRLDALAGTDAEALVACAEGLLALGEVPAARSALDRARSLAPEFTAKALRTRPDLAALAQR